MKGAFVGGIGRKGTNYVGGLEAVMPLIAAAAVADFADEIASWVDSDMYDAHATALLTDLVRAARARAAAPRRPVITRGQTR